MLRILLADHHRVVRAALRSLLTEAWEAVDVGETADGPATLAVLAGGAWDVLVLDSALPGPNGVFVLRQVRWMRPRLPVLLLGLYASPVYAAQSLKAGANGYLSKDNVGDELLPAIHAVLASGQYVSRLLENAPARPARRSNDNNNRWSAGPL